MQSSSRYIVSVLVPAYNMENTIVACVESVLWQMCAMPVEVIVVDDGSTDSTPALLDKLATERGISVVHQPNMGRNMARKVGVERARGEWIAFLDADDTLPSTAIGDLLRGVSDACDIVFGNGYTL